VGDESHASVLFLRTTSWSSQRCPLSRPLHHIDRSRRPQKPPEPFSTAATPRPLYGGSEHLPPIGLTLPTLACASTDLMSRHQPSGFATGELASNTRSKTALLPPRPLPHTNASRKPRAPYRLLQTLRPTNTP
jgi:hypothetical protein